MVEAAFVRRALGTRDDVMPLEDIGGKGSCGDIRNGIFHQPDVILFQTRRRRRVGQSSGHILTRSLTSDLIWRESLRNLLRDKRLKQTSQGFGTEGHFLMNVLYLMKGIKNQVSINISLDNSALADD